MAQKSGNPSDRISHAWAPSMYDGRSILYEGRNIIYVVLQATCSTGWRSTAEPTSTSNSWSPRPRPSPRSRSSSSGTRGWGSPACWTAWRRATSPASSAAASGATHSPPGVSNTLRVMNLLDRGSSHRRKSAACPKFDMVWQGISRLSQWGEGGNFLVQMIFTCRPYV